MKHRYFILRLAALAVAAAVLTGVCAPSLAATFTDVAEDEWYSQYVDILTEYLPNFEHIETGKSLDSKM